MKHINKSVDDLWTALGGAMETELRRVYDTVNDQAMAALAYSGRALGLRTSQRMALPMKASASLGMVSTPTHALAWLTTRVKELVCFSRKVERGQPHSTNAFSRWTGIMGKVTSKTGLPSVSRK